MFVSLSHLFNRAVHFLGLEPYSYAYSVPQETLNAIDKFFDSIDHLTVEQSHQPDEAKRLVDNFEELLRELKLYNSLHNLKELKKEKGENDPYRADGKTPNIFHEIRNCAHILGMIKNGKIEMNKYEYYGGLDADISARLRHDSIEDKAKSQNKIYAGMEANLHELEKSGEINAEELYVYRLKAVAAAQNTDLMTRKDAQIEIIDDENTGDEIAVIARKKSGKIKKEKRYGGDIHEYFIRMLKSPLAFLPKYSDRIENVGTRSGIDAFTLEKNHKYARETRHIYGTYDYDTQAMDSFPYFRKAIRAADAMLGIHLRIFEGVNSIKEEGLPNPDVPFEYRFNVYLPDALSAFDGIPECLHPIPVMLHSLSQENDPRIAVAVEKFVIPPIQTAIMEQGLSQIGDIPLKIPPQILMRHDCY